MPPLSMSLPDLLTLVSQTGVVPIDMISPVLDFVKNHFAGEFRLFTQRSIGYRLLVNLPGLDDLITTYEDL